MIKGLIILLTRVITLSFIVIRGLKYRVRPMDDPSSLRFFFPFFFPFLENETGSFLIFDFFAIPLAWSFLGAARKREGTICDGRSADGVGVGLLFPSLPNDSFFLLLSRRDTMNTKRGEAIMIWYSF